MPIHIYRIDADGTPGVVTDRSNLGGFRGWWNALSVADLDGDGDLDIIAGNRGLNALMTATPEAPARLYATDVDGNGTIDPIITYHIQGVSYPMPSRDELLDQVPALKKRFTTYAAYAGATISDIMAPERMQASDPLLATTFATTVFENDGSGSFRAHELPVEAQFAPVHAIAIADVDRDGLPDLILGGNDFGVRAQMGRYDAGRGLILLNRGDMTFEPVTAAVSGLTVRSVIRRIRHLATPVGTVLIIATNDDEVLTYLLRTPS